MKLTMKQNGQQIVVTAKTAMNSTINTQELSAFYGKRIKGFLVPKNVDKHNMEFVFGGLITVAQRLTAPMGQDEYKHMLYQIAETANTVRKYGFYWNRISWTSENVFYDVNKGDVYFMYVPESRSSKKGATYADLLMEISQKVMPADNDRSYANMFMNFIQSMKGKIGPMMIIEYIRTGKVNMSIPQAVPGAKPAAAQPVAPAPQPAAPVAQPVAPAVQPVAPEVKPVAPQPIAPEVKPVAPQVVPVTPVVVPVTPVVPQPVAPAAKPVAPAVKPVAPAPKAPQLKHVSDDAIVMVNKPEFSLGRGTEADFIVTGNKVVSKKHAVILVKEDGCYLKDLDSKNGVFLNGEQIDSGKEYKLKEKDMIVLGNEPFVFLG